MGGHILNRTWKEKESSFYSKEMTILNFSVWDITQEQCQEAESEPEFWKDTKLRDRVYPVGPGCNSPTGRFNVWKWLNHASKKNV